MKGKHKPSCKDMSRTDGSGPQQECLDQKTKLKTGESSNSQKDGKNKTYRYCGKTGHVEKTYWKKSANLDEKVNKLEGDVTIVQSTSWLADDFTFNVRTSQVSLA